MTEENSVQKGGDVKIFRARSVGETEPSLRSSGPNLAVLAGIDSEGIEKGDG